MKCLVIFYTNENGLVTCVIPDHATLSLAISQNNDTDSIKAYKEDPFYNFK